MKIVIIASDIHTGGGKVVLNDLLDAAKNMTSISFHILIDARFNTINFKSNNISFTKILKYQRDAIAGKALYRRSNDQCA